jgi:hydroxyacylglutathione hydrolase
MLQVSPVRAFADNYIWLIGAPRDAQSVVAVDPGDARPVEAALERHGLQLRAILVTHYHGDHVGGVRELAAGHGAPVWVRLERACLAKRDRSTTGTFSPLNSSAWNSP